MQEQILTYLPFVLIFVLLIIPTMILARKAERSWAWVVVAAIPIIGTGLVLWVLALGRKASP